MDLHAVDSEIYGIKRTCSANQCGTGPLSSCKCIVLLLPYKLFPCEASFDKISSLIAYSGPIIVLV